MQQFIINPAEPQNLSGQFLKKKLNCFGKLNVVATFEATLLREEMTVNVGMREKKRISHGSVYTRDRDWKLLVLIAMERRAVNNGG